MPTSTIDRYECRRQHTMAVIYTRWYPVASDGRICVCHESSRRKLFNNKRISNIRAAKKDLRDTLSNVVRIAFNHRKSPPN